MLANLSWPQLLLLETKHVSYLIAYPVKHWCSAVRLPINTKLHIYRYPDLERLGPKTAPHGHIYTHLNVAHI